MPLISLKQYDEGMKILDDGKDSESENYKNEYASLEVVEENGSRRQISSPQPGNMPSSRRMKIIRIAFIVLAILGTLTGMALLVRGLQKPDTNITINTQSLDNGTLNQLIPEGGDVKQQLTISPETLFKESVTVQGSSTVEGDMLIRGQVTTQEQATFEQDVAVRGTLNVGGGSAIGGNLSVTGSITAATVSVRTLTISEVNVSSDVSFGGHLIPNGAAPSTRPSTATRGGSVTINGNDTSGTVTINVGGGTPISGELAIITFAKGFTATPKVQLTPVNVPASSMDYYVTRSAGFFSINSSSAAASNTSYVFDYFVTQ